ncbi:MAG: fumarylacetoacetate hydrolase family protein [Burkholderiaceae bacterium]
MKYVRFGEAGREKPGAIDADGVIRDISSLVDDVTADAIASGALDGITHAGLAGLPAVEQGLRLGMPFTGTRKFLGIGLNYHDHAREIGAEAPAEPILFMKAVSSLSGPNDPVVLPPDSLKSDWEVELGVVIGKRVRNITAEQALDAVFGYCLVNDISERAWQMERGGTWDKGKGWDSFGPIGPWLVSRDEVTDPQTLDIWLELNGERMQSGNTADMIFDVRTLVSYLSQFMTLEPGDIITTGTPAGVGMGSKPQRFLKAGDIMTLGLAGLGEQRQEVQAYRPDEA